MKYFREVMFRWLSRHKGLIKLAISIAMLAIVFRTIDFDRLKSTFLSIPAWAIFTVIIGYTLGQCLSTIKWFLIAHSGGVNGSLPKAFRAYFIGMFVNNFGFGTLAGDLTRGLLLSLGSPTKGPAVASVIADRLHGLAVLALIGSGAVVVFGTNTLDWRLVALLVSIGPAVIIGWFVAIPVLVRLVPVTSPARSKVEAIARVFPKSPPLIALVTAISVVFHLLQISLHWIMAQGVGATIPWDYLLVAIPFVNIVSTLPISWNGLGVRENAYVFFLVPSLLAPEQAIAFGALWFVAVVLTSAIGGLVAVVTNDLAALRSAEDGYSSASPNSAKCTQ